VSRGVNGIISNYLLPAATLFGLLLVWEVAYRAFHIPKYIIPSPLGILAATWEWRGRLPGHAWVTLYETIAGFALSIAVATPLAVLLVYSPILRNAIYPLLVISQSVPKMALAPVLLLAIGHGVESKVLVGFLGAFFPIVVDTATGLSATPPELLDLSRSYRTSQLRTFVKVRFPWALPFFFSGLKVAITFSVTGAVIAEFVGSDKGLGYIILAATSYWKADLAFGSMLLLSLMGILLFTSISVIERVICPWYGEDPTRE